MMTLRGMLVVGLAVLAAACSKNPLGPSSVSSLSLSIVDGVTSQVIPGGGTVTYKNGSVNFANGTAQLENLSTGDRITISGVPGYRDRNTLFCGSSTFTMWPNHPGDVDDPMTEAMGYGPDGLMKRPEALSLVLSDELRADPEALAVHQDSAAFVMEVVQGKTRIVVAGSGDSRSGATMNVSVKPGLATDGYTTMQINSSKITGGAIDYSTLANARKAKVVRHEIAHALGLTGHNPYGGLMNANATTSDFTPAERNLLLLRYTRPVGAQFAGDNDQMTGCK